jgi:predicted HAD superfamily phosphohydrolase YqeG
MGIDNNKKQKQASTEAAVFDTQYSSPAAKPAKSAI